MESIEQTQLRLEAFAKETNPDVDLAPGSALSELIIKFATSMHNPIKNDIDELKQSNTISAVLSAAEDTFNPIMDALASNYGTVRNAGRKVLGKVKITVRERRSYFIDEAFTLIQPSLAITYGVTRTYSVVNKTTDAELSTGELRLIKEGSLYYFLLPVEAVNPGAQSQVSNNTKFTLGLNVKMPEFVQAEAYGTFTSGQDKESDRELITRFKLGLSTKNLVSPNAITSVLKDRFPTLKSINVLGANDSELIRSKNNIFGIAIPGKADVYVRTVESLETKKLILVGTLIETGDDAGKWKVNISLDDAPGFYRVTNIIKATGDVVGTQVFTKVTYNYVYPSSERVNDLSNAFEARFTKYQTAEIIFEYNPGSGAKTENFLVTILYQPYIKEIQNLFLSDTERVACADYLVKSVIPCNVSLHLKLVKKFALEDLPTDLIRRDIFTYINNLPFGEDLSVSKIIDICHNYDIKYVDLPVTIKGSIILPYTDKDIAYNLESTDALVIPTLPELGVSKLTTAFFINYFDNTGEENIGIEIT